MESDSVVNIPNLSFAESYCGKDSVREHFLCDSSDVFNQRNQVGILDSCGPDHADKTGNVTNAIAGGQEAAASEFRRGMFVSNRDRDPFRIHAFI